MAIILVTDYVEITYHPEMELIKVVWKGAVSTELYQKAFLTCLEFQKSAGSALNNFLSDTTQQGIISPENRKWFEQYAIPKAVEQGLKHAAVIFNGNVFKKYYLNLIISAINKFGIPLKLVSTEKEALDWFATFKTT